MGSMISLGIGRMEIDWGKNNVFVNHSVLFTESDIKQIPYYYYDSDTEKEFVEYKEGLSCKLSVVKRRLNMIGYSMFECEQKYNELLKDCSSHDININIDFNDFKSIIGRVNIEKINTPSLEYEYDDNGYDFGEFVRRCILSEKEFRNILHLYYSDDSYEMLSDLEIFFEDMDPYIILRLIAEKNELKDLEVYWAYADVVENGWATKEEILSFSQNASNNILVVTEGSSDTFVLQKTINTLYPELSHLFQFIDMQDNYPFTGTGNLYNFCCGLIKIGIMNKMIVIFDNDTAGLEKYNKLAQMPKSNNMVIIKLPNHCDFQKIETLGPQGSSTENINGLAVSIECFLDFRGRIPQVRWSSYNPNTQSYQGALVKKDIYIQDFKSADLTNGSYNTEKLRYLIEYILCEWEKHITAPPESAVVTS